MMKKQTRWLMLIGTLCMSFTLFTRSFINVPESISDFLKGFGVALIFSAFFLEKKKKQTCTTDVQNDRKNYQEKESLNK